MSALLEHRIDADALPRTYKPPVPRPTRLVLGIGHGRFLLPTGVSVQEAAALAHTLGQSIQITQHYDPATGGYTTGVARSCEFNPVTLSIVDPKDVSVVEDAPQTTPETSQ